MNLFTWLSVAREKHTEQIAEKKTAKSEKVDLYEIVYTGLPADFRSKQIKQCTKTTNTKSPFTSNTLFHSECCTSITGLQKKRNQNAESTISSGKFAAD